MKSIGLILAFISFNTFAQPQETEFSINSICIKESKIIKIDINFPVEGKSGVAQLKTFNAPEEVTMLRASAQLSAIMSLGSFGEPISQSTFRASYKVHDDKLKVTVYKPFSLSPFVFPETLGNMNFDLYEDSLGLNFNLSYMNLKSIGLNQPLTEKDCF